MISATWHRVAASTFLSINDVARARPLILVPPHRSAIGGGVDRARYRQRVRAGVHNPDNWDNLSGKTRTSRDARREAPARRRVVKAALKSDPPYALALIRLGRVQFLQDNVKAARESLERGAALAREPRHQFLAAMFMGALQESQNDLTAARQSYERALRIVPQSQHAVAALGVR